MPEKNPSSSAIPGDDELLFLEEEPGKTVLPRRSKFWKIMVVDDEEEVHNVTRLVLSNFEYRGRGLKFFSAYSAEEAKAVMKENPDIAIILLDVVMETDDAGLQFVKYLREELKNKFVRIILRTGQPGQAPESKVIVEYDINDYKEKTELTVQKLFTSVISSLRSFQDIVTIDHSRKGLEKIIDASANLFQMHSMKKFAEGVLTQLASILELDDSIYCHSDGFAATEKNGEFYTLAATGRYSGKILKKVEEVIPPDVLDDLKIAFKEKQSVYHNDRYIGYYHNINGADNLIYLECYNRLSKIDKDLIEIFCTNVSIAIDNIYLNKEIEGTLQEIIFTLGEIVEARSRETKNHVRRVSEYAKFLALEYGLSEEEAEIIRIASTMHDVGKLGIPDAILNKSGELTPEEFDIIKKHTTIGFDMLKGSQRRVLKAASTIAVEHHERYDGTGYPKGLKGEEIHIYARIIALVDVFDALTHDRVYKKSWPPEEVVQHLKQERGKHFDPKLVDLFLKNFDDILKIKLRYGN